jgi:hypothetical protein
MDIDVNFLKLVVNKGFSLSISTSVIAYGEVEVNNHAFLTLFGNVPNNVPLHQEAAWVSKLVRASRNKMSLTSPRTNLSYLRP